MVHVKIRITQVPHRVGLHPPFRPILTAILVLQDNSTQQRRILSAVRGRLRQVAASLQAAVRFRRFSRRGTTAPDWFVDKSHQEDQDVPDVTTRGCWGYRVVFDPALPIYYKVSFMTDDRCQRQKSFLFFEVTSNGNF